jgi:hypothetical protein
MAVTQDIGSAHPAVPARIIEPASQQAAARAELLTINSADRMKLSIGRAGDRQGITAVDSVIY